MDVLKLLGVGHSESVRFWNTNAIVEVGGKRLLIDAGYTIKYALRDQGLSIGDVSSIFITHVHADHCFGLERFAYECRFLYKFRPTLFLPPGVYEELWDQTLKGVLGFIGEGEAFLEDFFDVVVLDDLGFEFEGAKIELFENKHTPRKKSYGLVVNERVFYSGDTRAIPEILKRYDPEFVLHDVTLSGWNPVHASLQELRDRYTREQKKKMYLMSYQDNFEDFKFDVDSEFAGFARQGQEFLL